MISGSKGETENVGIVPLRDAVAMAAERNLDLVEIAPTADPPVCRIMDYRKFLYERAKKEREARKTQKEIEVKEIKIQLKTTDYHAGFKVNNARKWLEDGIKVRIRIQFIGREIDYKDLGRQKMNMILDELRDIAIIEVPPRMDGRIMIALLAPAKEVEKPKVEKKPARPPLPKPEVNAGAPAPVASENSSTDVPQA